MYTCAHAWTHLQHAAKSVTVLKALSRTSTRLPTPVGFQVHHCTHRRTLFAESCNSLVAKALVKSVITVFTPQGELALHRMDVIAPLHPKRVVSGERGRPSPAYCASASREGIQVRRESPHWCCAAANHAQAAGNPSEMLCPSLQPELGHLSTSAAPSWLMVS